MSSFLQIPWPKIANYCFSFSCVNSLSVTNWSWCKGNKVSCVFQCCGSMTFWYGSGSAESYLCIFTSFFKDKSIFAWWWKDPDLDPYIESWLADPDPGGPKTCGSCGSGSATLVLYFELEVTSLFICFSDLGVERTGPGLRAGWGLAGGLCQLCLA